MIIYEDIKINNNTIYLTESESITKLPAVPIIENYRLGVGVINLSNLDNIAEDYNCSYGDAFCAIAEQNELDPENLAISVEDWKLIESPELVDLVPNIVVKPISENNIVYQALDYCIDEYYDTGDEGYLNYLDEISDDLIRKVVGARYNKSQEMDNYIYDKKNKKHFWGSGDIDTKFDKSKAGRKNKKNYKTKKKFLKKHEEYDKVYNDYYENEIDDDKLENKFKKRGLNTYAKIHSYTYDLLSRNQDHRFKRYEKKRHEYEEKSNNEYKKLETNHDRFKRYEEEKRHEEHDDKNQETKSSTSSTHSFGTNDNLPIKNQETKSSTTSTHSFGTSGKPAVINNNNNRGFLSNHKKAIGLGAAGLVGAALAARKIAALRKQQQQHPGLRGKLQAIINRLKSKLRR